MTKSDFLESLKSPERLETLEALTALLMSASVDIPESVEDQDSVFEEVLVSIQGCDDLALIQLAKQVELIED